MLGKKKLLLGLVVVAVMLVGGITAGTYLLIEQPTSMTVTIVDLGDGGPTLDLIDNSGDPTDTTAGEKTGTVEDDDTYTMNFGPGGAGVVFGGNQNVWVGSTSDPIFTLENNYAKDLYVRLPPVSTTGNPHNMVGAGVDFSLISTTHPFPSFINTLWSGGAITPSGAHLIPAGQSRSYRASWLIRDQEWASGGSRQPDQSFTLALKLTASESLSPPMDWAVANLVPNDCLFDDVNEEVYHKLADGSAVEIIDFADFDYEAWRASWSTD